MNSYFFEVMQSCVSLFKPCLKGILQRSQGDLLMRIYIAKEYLMELV
ncbi:hypothetical protein FX988_03932 [Paraglaciecola mesophila]|uniref:Uncharacterized protein n=1 Tax=Paraglaciecola mesophila TaxID=197222 RepID=A0A857JP95_9ALTE|nr:hypothetical protein FX988_03932 [Paraglaciecola mesophila]